MLEVVSVLLKENKQNLLLILYLSLTLSMLLGYLHSANGFHHQLNQSYLEHSSCGSIE